MQPTSVGRYKIKKELGRGGMATVYWAFDPRFKRDVAIKVLPTELMTNATFRSRFEREAQTIAALDHPAIVPVFDVGEQDNQPYLVMRFMEGRSLAERIAKGPMPLEETARVLDRMAEALNWAHSKNIVHRDVKPANILFDRHGYAYLSDFGIVKLTEDTAHLTGTGIIGTPAYMAPETVDMGSSPLVDVYALGVTLFEMVSGQRPYSADTPSAVILAHITKPIPTIRNNIPDLPGSLQTVIERSMAKQPEDRYQSAGELAADLRRVVEGEDVEEFEPTVPMPASDVTPGAPGGIATPTLPPTADVEVAAVKPPKKARKVVPGCVLVGGGLAALAVLGVGLAALLGMAAFDIKPSDIIPDMGRTRAATKTPIAQSTEENQSQPSTEAPTANQELATYEIGDVIEIEDWTLVVLGWDTSSGNDYSAPQTGNMFVRIDLLGVNRGSEPGNPGKAISLQDDLGIAYEYDFKTVPGGIDNDAGFYGPVMPGQRIRGDMGFEIPEDVGNLTLIFDPPPTGRQGGYATINLGSEPASTPPPDTLPGETELEAYSASDVVDFEGLELTIHEITYPPGVPDYNPQTGFEWLSLDVTLRNTSSGPIEIWGRILTIRYPDGRLCYEDSIYPIMAEVMPLEGKLAAGESRNGIITFQVPADAVKLWLVFNPDWLEDGLVFISLKG